MPSLLQAEASTDPEGTSVAGAQEIMKPIPTVGAALESGASPGLVAALTETVALDTVQTPGHKTVEF